MKVIAIAAVASNGVMGRGNSLPWNIPEDLKFFRESTRNQIVLMGRKTYQSIGHALPHRENMIVTRDREFKAADAQVFHSIEIAIDHFRAGPEWKEKSLFIIGGAEIYAQSRDLMDELWLTEIAEAVEGDTYFPEYREKMLHWPEFEASPLRGQSDTTSPFHYQFTRFVRRV